MNSLKYLDAVICETLRLFPPFGFINRRSSQDYIIEEYNIKVPKGTTIHIPIHSIHYDPDYFTSPDQFKPERFFPENRNFHPYAFIPFGAGPRSCIGIRWALLKSKLALFHTIYNFKFSLIQQNSVCKIVVYLLFVMNLSLQFRTFLSMEEHHFCYQKLNGSTWRKELISK